MAILNLNPKTDTITFFGLTTYTIVPDDIVRNTMIEESLDDEQTKSVVSLGTSATIFFDAQGTGTFKMTTMYGSEVNKFLSAHAAAKATFQIIINSKNPKSFVKLDGCSFSSAAGSRVATTSFDDGSGEKTITYTSRIGIAAK